MNIRDLIDGNKKEKQGKSRIRDLVQSGYDSLGSKKYDEEERKEAEGDGSLSPSSSYRTANRERAEAAVTGYRQALESEKLARQSYMQRFGVMDAEDRSDKFMDPALSAASKAQRMRQNTEKARRMFGIHEDADEYAAAARKAANEATARIRTQAGEIDALGGTGTAASMRAALAAEQIARTAPKKTTNALDKYLPPKDPLANMKDALGTTDRADKNASAIDKLYGAGASDAVKTGAWENAIEENRKYYSEKAKERAVERFGSVEAYEDAARAYSLGWNKGEVDREGEVDRVKRRNAIDIELQQINEKIDRLKSSHTPMVNEAQYQRQLAILNGKKKRLENEAASYDAFQGKIDSGDQFAIMESRLYGGDSESRELTYAELSEEAKRLEGLIAAGTGRQEYITHDDGTVEYLTANPARYEEYVTADGVKTGKTNEEALEWLRTKLKTYERQYRPVDQYYEILRDYDTLMSDPSISKKKNDVDLFLDLYSRGERMVKVVGEGSNDVSLEAANPDLSPEEQSVLVLGSVNRWNEFNEDELKILRYLYGSGQTEKAEKFARDMEPILGKREQSDYEKKIAEASALDKILLAAAGTVQRGLGGLAPFAEDVAATLTGNEINPYGFNRQMQNRGQAIMEQGARDMDEAFPDLEIFGQSAGKIYQGMQSGIDSGVSRALFGRASSVIMGLGAATSTAKDLWEKGASDEQIAVGAGLAGIAETVFEYVSLEMAFKNFLELPPANQAEWITKGLMQMGVEGSEEFVTDGVNLITDYINMHSQSEFAEMMRKYTDQGYSDAEAFGKAFWRDALNGKLRDAFIGGALGTVFSTGGALVNSYADVQNTGRDVQEIGAADRLIKAARNISEKIPGRMKRTAVERAADRAARTQNAADVGFLANAVEKAVNNNIEDAGEQNAAAQQVARALFGTDYTKASDPESGEAVAVDKESPVARVEGDTVYMNTDRGEIPLSELAFDDDDVRDLIYAAGEYGVEHANNILSNYGGEDVAAYVAGMREGIHYGQYGDIGEDLADLRALSAGDQKVAVNIGKIIRADRVAAEAKKAQNATLTATNNDNLTSVFTAHVGDKPMKGASGTVGEVYFDRGVEATSDLDRANVDFAKAVANVYGNKIVFFDSTKRGDLKNANGFHVGADGSIWVDLRAGERRQGLVAYTIAHELTHDAEQWAPETYQRYVDFLLKNYGEAGVSVDRMVRNKMAAMNTNDYDAALRDVVADASEKFLLDSNAMEKLAGLRKTDEGLFKRIVSWIRAQIAKIKEAYNKMKASGEWEQTEASRALEAVGEKIGEIEKMWSGLISEAAQSRKAAVERAAKGEATETSPHPGPSDPPSPQGEGSETKYSTRVGAGEQAVNDMGIAIDKGSESAYPDQFSLRTWNESDYQKNISAAAKELAAALDVSESKARKYIRDVNSVAKIIAADRSRLDFEAAPGLSSFVSNVEYGGSIDFSTICKKRRLMTGTMAAIQDAIGNKALSIRDYLDIRNMMKERNYEVSCGLCYVEGSRANMGKFAEKFRELYRKYNPDAEWIPTQSDCVNPDKVEKMRVEHPEVYEEYEHFWNNHGKLREEDPNLFASQQKPKLFQADTEYNGEILDTFRKDGKVDKDAVNVKNKNGGLRIQSFSDFEIIHLLDSMQVITDMSRVGLAGQSYTKVADFARALGGTGLKINLSLIAKGVDENGQIILDEVEGMKRSDAEELRNKYSENVGTILVAFNDEQLKAALNDPFIDFIIPFHRSQWASKYYDAMGLPKGVKDFTNKQNEKLLRQTYHEFRGRMVKDKAKNFMPNAYWDFNKSGKENAEEYLRMCAAANKKPKFDSLLVNNGDGSYSLQPDGSTDGYWKLLIDFKMYDNEGKGAPQRPVTPTFDTAEAERMLAEYEGGHDTYPVAQDVVDEFVKKNGGEENVRYSTRTGVSTSTRAVVERALETAKEGSPEATALTAYKRVLDQIDEQIREYNDARKNRDAAAAAAAKTQIKNLQAKARRMETAPAMKNVAGMQDVAALNEDVRNLSRLLKLQGTETGGVIAVKSSLERAASELMKKHGVRRGKAELVELLNNFYTDMTREVRAETLNREYMVAAAQPVARWLIDNQPVQKEIDAEVNDVLKTIKGTRIYVNDQQRGDIVSRYESYDKWRKSLSPYVTVTNDRSATALDSWWAELAEQYPAYFDETVADADKGVMLSGIISDLKDRRVTEYYETPESYGWLIEVAANDVAEAFWRIKPYETVADKYAKEIRELKASHSYRSVGEILRNEREKIWRRGYDVAVQRAQRAELRRRIRTLYENISNRLLKPKKERYVPYDLRQAVAQVLSIINTDSGRSATLSAKLGEMRQQYETILEMPKFQEHYDPDLAERIKDLQEVVKAENGDGNLSISDMTFEQLDAVYQTIKWFDKTMREEVKMRDLTINGINRDVPITEVRDKWTREIEGAKKKTSIPEMIEMWKWSPEAYFETIAGFKKDSYSSAIFNLLNESQRKMHRMIMEGNFYLKEFLRDEKFLRKITDTKKGLIDTGLKNKDGENIKVTRDIAHALYLGLANANYRLHVMSSGGTFPDLEKYYAGKSNAYSEGNGTRYAGLAGKAMTDLRAEIDENIEVFKEEREKARILQDFEAVEAYNKAIRAEWEKWGELVGEKHDELLDIRDKIQSQFDAQELRYLERVHDYYNIFTKARMNEASNQRFGFDIADEPDYIQIITDPNFRTESVANRVREMTNVANKGFTQRRIQAKNPLIFAGLTDMVKDHLKATAAYTAFLNPIYDMNRLIGPSEGGMEYTQSVRHALEENFGKTGKDYLDNLLINAQGGSFGKVKSDTIDRMFEWGRSKVGSAALNMNLNTAFVQTGSLLTAISELGWRPVMKAFPMMFAKSKANVINENTPLYWMRSTNEMTAMLENARQIRKKRTVAKKLLHPITSMIQFFDNRTINALWYASEFYVEQNTDLKKGTPEYINAVTDAFNKTVERTQPNYTALQRPEILRNENALLKTIEMFKTQRYQNRNMLYMNTARALQFAKDLKNGVEGVTKQDVKRARIKAANTWASQIMSSAYISLIKYIIPGLLLFRLDPWKDKETGELTPQSVLTKLLDDMLNSFFGNDTITSELYNIIGSVVFERKYYAGLSTGYMESINEGLEKIGDVAAKLKAGKITQKNAVSEIDDMAEKFSGWFGIPYRNARNLIAGIYSHVQNVASGNIFKLDLSGTNAQFGQRMLKAYHNGDVEQLKEIRGLFKATEDKTAREVADSALLDAVYEEWAAGAIDDREALDILEDCLAKPPKTENDERIRIEKWENKKANADLPKEERTSYGVYDDLKGALRAYVFPSAGADIVTAGRKAQAMIEQYRAWGYDDTQIRDAIRNTVKGEYVAMAEGKDKDAARDYIAKLYTFTKDSKGKDYKDKDAKKLIDKWKAAEKETEEEEDEREWG